VSSVAELTNIKRQKVVIPEFAAMYRELGVHKYRITNQLHAMINTTIIL